MNSRLRAWATARAFGVGGLLMFASGASAQTTPTIQLDAPIDINALIPDPNKWMVEIMHSLGQAGMLSSFCAFALVICMVLTVFGTVNAIWGKRSPGMALKVLLMGAVMSGLINDLRVEGPTAGIPKLVMNSFASSYTASNEAAKALFTDSMHTDATELATAMAKYVANATIASRAVSSVNFANISQEKDSVNSQVISDAMNASRTNGDKMAETMKNQSWIVAVAYILIMGLFMVYSGVVVVLGVTLLLTIFALPFAMAVVPIGNTSGVQKVMFGWVGSIATIGIIPFVFVAMTHLALGLPQQAVLHMVHQQNRNADGYVKTYVAQAQDCKNRQPLIFDVQPITDQQCTAMGTFSTQLAELGSEGINIMMGIIITALVFMVGMGAAAAVIRQVPAVISGVIGGLSASFGGISDRNPLPAMAAGAGAAAAGMMKADQALTAGATRMASAAGAGVISTGQTASAGIGALSQAAKNRSDARTTAQGNVKAPAATSTGKGNASGQNGGSTIGVTTSSSATGSAPSAAATTSMTTSAGTGAPTAVSGSSAGGSNVGTGQMKSMTVGTTPGTGAAPATSGSASQSSSAGMVGSSSGATPVAAAAPSGSVSSSGGLTPSNQGASQPSGAVRITPAAQVTRNSAPAGQAFGPAKGEGSAPAGSGSSAGVKQANSSAVSTAGAPKPAVTSGTRVASSDGAPALGVTTSQVPAAGFGAVASESAPDSQTAPSTTVGTMTSGSSAQTGASGTADTSDTAGSMSTSGASATGTTNDTVASSSTGTESAAPSGGTEGAAVGTASGKDAKTEDKKETDNQRVGQVAGAAALMAQARARQAASPIGRAAESTKRALQMSANSGDRQAQANLQRRFQEQDKNAGAVRKEANETLKRGQDQRIEAQTKQAQQEADEAAATKAQDAENLANTPSEVIAAQRNQRAVATVVKQATAAPAVATAQTVAGTRNGEAGARVNKRDKTG